jgi:hypothetical protein
MIGKAGLLVYPTPRHPLPVAERLAGLPAAGEPDPTGQKRRLTGRDKRAPEPRSRAARRLVVRAVPRDAAASLGTDRGAGYSRSPVKLSSSWKMLMKFR